VRCEFERPQVLLKIPNHDYTVIRTCHKLLEIRVELHLRDETSLALESLYILRHIRFRVNRSGVDQV
jgi:hypothetical protein